MTGTEVKIIRLGGAFVFQYELDGEWRNITEHDIKGTVLYSLANTLGSLDQPNKNYVFFKTHEPYAGDEKKLFFVKEMYAQAFASAAKFFWSTEDRFIL